MRDLLKLIRWMLLGLVRSRRSLEAENLALRHQLNVLHRLAVCTENYFERIGELAHGEQDVTLGRQGAELDDAPARLC